MQTRRSGLAAAAAKMQLTDAPEGKSSLQSRLSEAERRAQDAEASAQDARAALARTLLEAAQVEAVVMARVKAQSDAELVALRSELDAIRRAGSTPEAGAETSPREAEPRTERRADDTAAPQPQTVASSEPASAPVVRLRETDRPLDWEPEDEPVEDAKILRFLPPLRLAVLAFLAAGVIVGYLTAASFTGGNRADRMAAADSATGSALVRGDATDPAVIAEASATLDAEMSRIEQLSRKVAALRSMIADRLSPATSSTAPAATASAAAETGWLLYMPVERPALVSYLAGGSWPGIQVAVHK